MLIKRTLSSVKRSSPFLVLKQNPGAGGGGSSGFFSKGSTFKRKKWQKHHLSLFTTQDSMVPVNSDGVIQSSTSQQRGRLLTGLVLGSRGTSFCTHVPRIYRTPANWSYRISTSLDIPLEVCHQRAPLTFSPRRGWCLRFLETQPFPWGSSVLSTCICTCLCAGCWRSGCVYRDAPKRQCTCSLEA